MTGIVNDFYHASFLFFENLELMTVLLQLSQELLARNLLELTTSLPDAFSIQSGEIVSFPQVLCWLALYFKRAQPKLPQDNDLSPRRKSPSSREIVIIRELFTASHSNFPIDAAFKEVYNRVVNRFAN